MTGPISSSDRSRPIRRTAWVLGAAVLLLLLAACAPGNEYAAHEAGNPGFWRGLWHGLISPITFIISLFNDEVGIYAPRNTGAWYDAGFMIGVSAVFSGSGGGAAAGPRRRRSERS